MVLFLACFFLTNFVEGIDVADSSEDFDGNFCDSVDNWENFLDNGLVFLFGGVFSLGDLIFGFEESRSKLTSKEFGWDEEDAPSTMLRLSSSTIILVSSKLAEVSSRILESKRAKLDDASLIYKYESI